jgi:hypothetical protein
LDVNIFALLAKIYKKRIYDYNIYDILNIDKSIFLELLYETRKEAIFDYNIINTFQKTDLYSFNPFIIFEKLRSRSIILSNIIIITDIFENRIEITINYSITAKKIDFIIEKIKEGSRDSLLFEESCNTVIKAKTDYTLIYKACDDIIDAVRRRRRAARFRKDCGEAKYLTVIRIEAIEEESAPADEIKRKKKKERYWALYGKGKLA